MRWPEAEQSLLGVVTATGRPDGKQNTRWHKEHETVMTGRITPSSKHILSVFSFNQNRLKLLHAAGFVRNAGACAHRAHTVCV